MRRQGNGKGKYIHTYTHTYIHTYIHTHIHTYIHTYRCTPCFSPGSLHSLCRRVEADNFYTAYRMAQKLLDSRYVTTGRCCVSNFLDRHSDFLRAGRSGDRIPMGARFSPPVQTGPGAHPASYTMGTGLSWGVQRPGRGVDHPPHLASRLKKE